MAGAAARFKFLDKLDERGGAIDLAVGDRVVDARQVLHHHAPGADVEMADLGIAHLAIGQSDILAGGVQEAVRAGLPKPVERRRFGLAHGVVGCFLAPAPSVQNDQHHRPPLLHVAFLSRITRRGYRGSWQYVNSCRSPYVREWSCSGAVCH